jgi:hypothetical protein
VPEFTGFSAVFFFVNNVNGEKENIEIRSRTGREKDTLKMF